MNYCPNCGARMDGEADRRAPGQVCGDRSGDRKWRNNMSCDLWAYEPKKCDGGFCCGECDNCHKAKDRQADWSYITLAIRAAVAVTVDKLNELQEQRIIKKERSLFE